MKLKRWHMLILTLFVAFVAVRFFMGQQKRTGTHVLFFPSPSDWSLSKGTSSPGVLKAHLPESPQSRHVPKTSGRYAWYQLGPFLVIREDTRSGSYVPP